MLFVVDGSNVLGRAGALRDDDAKRALVGRLAAFTREKRSRAILFFDGPHPPGFPTHMGAVEVRFHPGTSADEAIVRVIATQRIPVTLISADLGLFARVRGRSVKRLDPAVLQREESRGGGEQESDWEEYFSDPKNRNI